MVGPTPHLITRRHLKQEFNVILPSGDLEDIEIAAQPALSDGTQYVELQTKIREDFTIKLGRRPKGHKGRVV